MKKLLILSFSLWLSGCMALGIDRQSSTRYGATHVANTAMLSSFRPADHRLIAENLVHVLAQLDGSSPITTTVQLPEAKTPFGTILHKAIVDVGYGHQAVVGDIGENLVRYKAENSETETGYRTLYRVEIGEAFAEREYRVENRMLLPTSPYRVSGTNEELALNDYIFDESVPTADYAYVTARAGGVPEIKVFDVPQYKLVEAPQTPTIIRSAGLGAVSSGSQLQNIYGGKKNIYDTKRSNFEGLFSQYEGISTKVLIFPNDSLRLGGKNKRLIKSLAASFDPESEVFSVLGCSQGITDLDNGNEYLAVGRAARVKEELLLHGVAENKIFDEGCWGADHEVKDMPTRGVVLTRKRQSVG